MLDALIEQLGQVQPLAANMRHFGALRLDHVMALIRQWSLPVGQVSADGGYVHCPLDDVQFARSA